MRDRIDVNYGCEDGGTFTVGTSCGVRFDGEICLRFRFASPPILGPF